MNRNNSLVSMSGKQYGLQIPKKSNQKPLSRSAVFNDDSDSDKSEGGGDWVKKTAKSFSSSVSKRQTKLEIDKALQEDATVFQYDEIYDDLELQKKSNSSSSREKERKPKYLPKLLVAAEKRKMENERRHERLVQKEREAEGDQFKDKETFVTSAYKKKLEEFAQLDAEQKRMDMLEDIGDVTKQQDMSGFYRHLYSQAVEKKEEDVKESKENPTGKEASTKTAGRQYRKRKDSESSADKGQDADSNFGSSSSGTDSTDTESGEISSHSDTEDPKRLRLKKYKKEPTPQVKSETPIESKSNIKTEEVKPEIKEKELEGPAAPDIKEKLPPPPPVDIWKKRTVGPVFEAAFQRYLERKAARKTS